MAKPQKLDAHLLLLTSFLDQETSVMPLALVYTPLMQLFAFLSDPPVYSPLDVHFHCLLLFILLKKRVLLKYMFFSFLFMLIFHVTKVMVNEIIYICLGGDQ